MYSFPSKSLLTILTLCTFSCSSYLVSYPRTDLVISSCSSIPRQDFVRSLGTYQTNQGLKQGLSQMYQLEQEKIFEATLSFDLNTLYSSLQRDTKSYAINFVVLCIGAAILLILAPILCTSICCHKNICRLKLCDSNNFRCLFRVSLIVFSGAIMGLSIYLFFFARSFAPVYKDFKCSTAIAIDDLINGNNDISKELYFSGIRTWKNNLPYLYGYEQQLQQINSQFQASKNDDIGNLIEEGSLLEQDFSNIQSFEYKYPLLSTSNQRKINSKISEVLDKHILKIKEGVRNITDLIKKYNDSATKFEQSGQNFSDSYKVAVSQLETSFNSAQDFQFKLQKAFYILEEEGTLKLTQILLYSLLGALTLFGFLSILLNCYHQFSKNKQKECPRFFCISFWILGVVAFALGFIFSLGLPIFFSGCEVTGNAMQDEESFREFVGKYFPMGSASDFVVSCFGQQEPGMTFIVGEQINSLFQSLETNLNLNEQFQKNFENYKNQIGRQYLVLHESIDIFASSGQMDIDDPDALAQFGKISNASNYNCSDEIFSSDHWVFNPFSSEPYSQCPTNSFKVTKQTCQSTRDFELKSQQCIGCINTFQILSMYPSRYYVQKALNIRYPGCGLTPTSFNAELTNLWSNYYIIKQSKLNQARVNLYEKSPMNFIQKVQTIISPLVFSQKQKLADQRFDVLLSSENGLLTGKSCSIVGDDIRNSHRIICSKGTEFIFIIKTLVTIIAFMVMMNLCCLGCLNCHQEQERSSNREISRKSTTKKTETRTDKSKKGNPQLKKYIFKQPHEYLKNKGETNRQLKF